MSTNHFITEQTMTIKRLEIRRKSDLKIVRGFFIGSNVFRQMDWYTYYCLHNAIVLYDNSFVGNRDMLKTDTPVALNFNA